MSKIFEMRLQTDPFLQICSGEKTIEYRLHDEKRSLLNQGDYIRFTESTDKGTGRTLLVEIVDIITALSFAALKQKLIEMGQRYNESLSPTEMRRYYSAEDEARYGVMGIKIKVVDLDHPDP